MRLADFILENMEPILSEWEVFARTIHPAAKLDRVVLRDHAQDILRATARDMMSAQSDVQQTDKSKGNSDVGSAGERLRVASRLHAQGRVDSGFDLLEVVSEYRALRASVIRLWGKRGPHLDRDLSDLTRFNEAIDESLTDAVASYTKRVDQSRQMFLAILGHDLRNPLTSIVMVNGLLVESEALDATSIDLVSRSSASAAAILRMTTDLIDYANTELGGKMPIVPASMDLQALCREVFDECQATAPTAKLRFESQSDITGTWDSARLRQVVSNLLGNAIQHGGDSVVDVTLISQGTDVILTLHNDGPPILAAVIATLFEPLVRGGASEAATDHRPGSIGLGLYIAREIVTAHDGTLTVKSSLEVGTIFTLSLPRHGVRASEASRSVPRIPIAAIT
jgi:signal transduction histidine kinase